MIAAGALYCSLLLEVAAGFPLNVHTSFLSELGARDQPTSPYARAMDLLSGVLLLVAAILARPAARLHREVGGLVISTVVFGAGTLFDSLSPMDCAPSVSAGCHEADGLAGVLHEVTSSIAGLGSVALGIFVVLVLRRFGWGGRLGRAVAVLAAGVVVTQTWLGIETGLGVMLGDDVAAPGILQRVSILLVCLMLGLCHLP